MNIVITSGQNLTFIVTCVSFLIGVIMGFTMGYFVGRDDGRKM